MKKDPSGVRLHLSLFDGIVLVLALCVGAFLAWHLLAPAENLPAEDGAPQSSVRYTIRLGPLPEGTHQLIQAGDQLFDNVRNYALGSVVSWEPTIAQEQILDEADRRFVISEIEGYEDVLITVDSPCNADSKSITVGGGFVLQVGKTVYVRGQGYLGTAKIVEIQRGTVG